MSPPLVSVGIPTYNQPDFLREAIQSVLNQTFQDFEIIVVDDCSTDDTPEVVRQFDDPRIRYHRTESNLRPPRSWNVCAREAKGKYFALLPHDDAWLPQFLKEMVALLLEEPTAGLAQCGIYHVDEKFRPYSVKRMKQHQGFIGGVQALIKQLDNLLCNPAAILFSTDAMRKMGLWREDYWDDWAFIVRLSYRYGFVYTPKALACVREHQTNLCRVLGREGRDGALDTLNQLNDVFGEALPASLLILAYRNTLNRSLSYSCFFHALRALMRGAWANASLQFKRSRYLNPLMPLDPLIIKHVLTGLIRCCTGRVRAAGTNPPLLHL